MPGETSEAMSANGTNALIGELVPLLSGELRTLRAGEASLLLSGGRAVRVASLGLGVWGWEGELAGNRWGFLGVASCAWFPQMG